jgi:hypothetical protein
MDFENDLRVQRLEHAKWRVRMARMLLDSHWLLPRFLPEWKAKEEEYMKRLEEAEAELKQIERAYGERA